MDATTLPQTFDRMVLARRPHGEPVVADFETQTLPLPGPAVCVVLLRIVYLSLDP